MPARDQATPLVHPEIPTPAREPSPLPDTGLHRLLRPCAPSARLAQCPPWEQKSTECLRHALPERPPLELVPPAWDPMRTPSRLGRGKSCDIRQCRLVRRESECAGGTAQPPRAAGG